jgi:pantothenate kinase-related protein Tda10
MIIGEDGNSQGRKLRIGILFVNVRSANYNKPVFKMEADVELTPEERRRIYAWRTKSRPKKAHSVKEGVPRDWSPISRLF